MLFRSLLSLTSYVSLRSQRAQHFFSSGTPPYRCSRECRSATCRLDSQTPRTRGCRIHPPTSSVPTPLRYIFCISPTITTYPPLLHTPDFYVPTPNRIEQNDEADIQYIHMYIHRQRQGGVHSNPIHGRLLLLSAHPGMPATRKTLSRGNAGQSVVSTLMHVQGASQHATDWIYPTSLTQATIVRKISMIDFLLSQSENGIGMAWHGLVPPLPCPRICSLEIVPTWQRVRFRYHRAILESG